MKTYTREELRGIAEAEGDNLLLWAADEIDRLTAIVDRLPKTADGIPIAPGDSVFLNRTQTLLTVGSLENTWGGRVMWRESHGTILRDGIECYSTSEAADAAKSEEAIRRCEAAEKARTQ